jgi:hypothetical protein
VCLSDFDGQCALLFSVGWARLIFVSGKKAWVGCGDASVETDFFAALLAKA